MVSPEHCSASPHARHEPSVPEGTLSAKALPRQVALEAAPEMSCLEFRLAWLRARFHHLIMSL